MSVVDGSVFSGETVDRQKGSCVKLDPWLIGINLEIPLFVLHSGGEAHLVAAVLVQGKVVIEALEKVPVVRRVMKLGGDAKVESGASDISERSGGDHFAVDGRVMVRIDGDEVSVQGLVS